MSRFVVLRHEVPRPRNEGDTTASRDVCGVVHFDWMLQPPLNRPFKNPDDRCLMTWRIDSLPITDGMSIIRIDDHRLKYLDYEGPISGDRGHVTRVASGNVEWFTMGEKEFRFKMDFDEGWRQVIQFDQNHESTPQLVVELKITALASTRSSEVGVNYQLTFESQES